MKLKSLVITVCITTLTACAVQENDDAKVVVRAESGIQSHDIISESIDQPAIDPGSVLASPTEPEEADTGGRTSSYAPLVQTTPVMPYESDVVMATEQPVNDRMTASKHRLTTSGPIGTGMVHKELRHAGKALYRENYQHPENHSVMRVSSNPVSTFSIDVDSGAYSNMRRWLNQGQLPPEDAVRVEELINYFGYDYPLPEDRSVPFSVSTVISPTPWNGNTHLLRVGIQGYRVPKARLPASNLVFLIDVSGSMNSADKLPLLQQALTMLVAELDAHDRISIVVYAGASGVVLPATHGDRKSDILAALQQLRAGGSTNGAAGIRLAYQLAQQNFIKDGVNRVILATDGDFNVGLASTEELLDLIQRKRIAGIALTTLGFGSGNYNDHLLEQLADQGNGNYAYIDRLFEARKVLSEELSATLLTIARDVKIQIEFNPARVSEYRLIGYENRGLNEEDFANDKVDAGEIGAGHRVTALYEISLTGSNGQRLPERRYQPGSLMQETVTGSPGNELAHLRIRYKLLNESKSQLIQVPVTDSNISTHVDDSFNFAAAVAAFGQKLRGGIYLEDFSFEDIEQLARQFRGNDPHGYRSEFVQLVGLAGTLDQTENLVHIVNKIP